MKSALRDIIIKRIQTARAVNFINKGELNPLSDFSFLTDGAMYMIDHWNMLIMWLIGGLLIWLAIKKDFEPALLLPMGFGAILVNLPLPGVLGETGIVQWLFEHGIEASPMTFLTMTGFGKKQEKTALL